MSNAKNVKVKPVELEINGENYKIKYNFNAFIELEDKYGSIDVAMEKLQGEVVKDTEGKPVMIEDDDGKKVEKRKFNLRVMRDFLWCGLLSDKPDMTALQAGELLELSNFQYIVQKMMEAITASLPEKVDDEKN
jgi:hypothetical protein